MCRRSGPRKGKHVEDPTHRAGATQRQHPVLRVLPAPRPAPHRRGPQRRRPRRAHLLPSGGADRPCRRRHGRSRRHLRDDIYCAGGLRAGRRTSGRRPSRGHRRPSPDLRARRRPAARRLRGARRGRRWPDAGALRGARRRTRAGEHPRAVLQARRALRAQRAARALPRSRCAPDTRPLTDRRCGAHAGDADHHQSGVPLRLHVLHRDDDVRARLPVAQPRERHRPAGGARGRARSSSTTTTSPPTSGA